MLNQEKHLYDPRVWVGFQKCAWFDRPTQKKWFAENLSPFLEAEYTRADGTIEETLGMYDSLDASKCKEFVEVANAKNHRISHGPTNATEYWQPVDFGGIAAQPNFLQGTTSAHEIHAFLEQCNTSIRIMTMFRRWGGATIEENVNCSAAKLSNRLFDSRKHSSWRHDAQSIFMVIPSGPMHPRRCFAVLGREAFHPRQQPRFGWRR